MSIEEKIAHLKGLAEGLGIDGSTKEGKLLLAIVDTLDEMTLSMGDLEESCEELAELTEILDKDLGDLENDFYDCDEDCICGDEDLFEVERPACGESVYLDDDLLREGEIECPGCGEMLEFDFSGCDCDCEDVGCECGCEKPE